MKERDDLDITVPQTIEKTERSRMQGAHPIIIASQPVMSSHVGGAATERQASRPGRQPDSQGSTVNTYKLSPSSSMARLNAHVEREQEQRVRALAGDKNRELEHTVHAGGVAVHEASSDHSRTMDLHDYM